MEQNIRIWVTEKAVSCKTNRRVTTDQAWTTTPVTLVQAAPERPLAWRTRLERRWGRSNGASTTLSAHMGARSAR
jgi:hypothetical protein